MKLLIRNLARTTTEAELRAMFEAHGNVQSCNLVLDKISGDSKGFGFVEMPHTGDAKAAMKNINGKELAGNKIRVKKAESKPDAADAETTTPGKQSVASSQDAKAEQIQRTPQGYKVVGTKQRRGAGSKK